MYTSESNGLVHNGQGVSPIRSFPYETEPLLSKRDPTDGTRVTQKVRFSDDVEADVAPNGEIDGSATDRVCSPRPLPNNQKTTGSQCEVGEEEARRQSAKSRSGRKHSGASGSKE